MIAPLLRRSLPLALLSALACTILPSTGSSEVKPPEGFTSLYNGKDLSGWYGWGTRDPREFQAQTPEAQAEYKKQSVEGGPAIKGDFINAHWKTDGDEIVNDGKGLYLTT